MSEEIGADPIDSVGCFAAMKPPDDNTIGTD